MGEPAHEHRRRRSLVVGSSTDDYPEAQKDPKEKLKGRKCRRSQGDVRTQRKDAMSDDPGSEPSSCSTSEDVELEDLLSDEGPEDDEEAGLSKMDRRRRRRRKERNSRLDSRVMKDVKTTNTQRSLADRVVLKESLINAVLIGLWYLFSLSISIYNKWMFSPDHLDFHFPLFTTCVHMLVQFGLASLVLYFIPRFRPDHNLLKEENNNHSDNIRPSDPQNPLMTRMFYITRIGPCGTATGLDIGLGNMSLKFISLTFYTMCKSSSLAFVLIFAFLFRLESPSIRLILIIVTMTIGVVMMVAGETAFNTLGFILIISAAFFSGFRWALTQILLLRNPATSNPFSSIFYLAPFMFVSLLIIAIPVEGVRSLMERLRELLAIRGVFLGTGILLFPGLIAFLMTSSEFALLQRTSVVTLSICGIFKEVITISAAGIVFHDPLTPINVSGLLVTISSIVAYNYIKIKKMRREALQMTVAGNSTVVPSSREYTSVLSGEEIEGNDDSGSESAHEEDGHDDDDDDDDDYASAEELRNSRRHTADSTSSTHPSSRKSPTASHGKRPRVDTQAVSSTLYHHIPTTTALDSPIGKSGSPAKSGKKDDD